QLLEIVVCIDRIFDVSHCQRAGIKHSFQIASVVGRFVDVVTDHSQIGLLHKLYPLSESRSTCYLIDFMSKIFASIRIPYPGTPERPACASSHVDTHAKSVGFPKDMYQQVNPFRRQEVDEGILFAICTVDRSNFETAD